MVVVFGCVGFFVVFCFAWFGLVSPFCLCFFCMTTTTFVQWHRWMFCSGRQLGFISVGDVQAGFVRCFNDVQLEDDKTLQQTIHRRRLCVSWTSPVIRSKCIIRSTGGQYIGKACRDDRDDRERRRAKLLHASVVPSLCNCRLRCA